MHAKGQPLYYADENGQTAATMEEGSNMQNSLMLVSGKKNLASSKACGLLHALDETE